MRRDFISFPSMPMLSAAHIMPAMLMARRLLYCFSTGMGIITRQALSLMAPIDASTSRFLRRHGRRISLCRLERISLSRRRYALPPLMARGARRRRLSRHSHARRRASPPRGEYGVGMRPSPPSSSSRRATQRYRCAQACLILYIPREI